jgi:hypothetical protein
VERAATRFIRTYRTRPFALYINMLEPQPPYTGPFDDLYDPASIPVSPTFLKSPPENAALMHRSIEGDADSEEFGAEEWNGDGWRRLRARYWGNVRSWTGRLAGSCGHSAKWDSRTTQSSCLRASTETSSGSTTSF